MVDSGKESVPAPELNGKAISDGWSFFSRPCLSSVLFAFALSRILIAATVVLTANIVFQPVVHTVLGDLYESNNRLTTKGVVAPLRQVTQAADSAWLMNIAINGYEKEPFTNATQHTWAYFPLYPLVLRGAAKVTGEYPLTGMVLSNVFFLLALLFLYQTALEFGCNIAAADRTVIYLALFPVSYFFSLAQTEALFLLLTVASVYFAKRQGWWLAGTCGALASATRFAGVFLLVPLCLIYWQTYRAIDGVSGQQPGGMPARPSGRIRANALALLLMPVGLLAFMFYLRSITGNAFAFSDIQVAWGHSLGLFWRPLLTYLVDPLQVSAGWDFRLLNFAAAVTALACSVVLLKRREWALGSLALLSIIVPMSYQPLLQSFARYVLVIFPIFFVLAALGRRPRVDQVIRAVFIGLLCLMTALLAARATLSFS